MSKYLQKKKKSVNVSVLAVVFRQLTFSGKIYFNLILPSKLYSPWFFWKDFLNFYFSYIIQSKNNVAGFLKKHLLNLTIDPCEKSKSKEETRIVSSVLQRYQYLLKRFPKRFSHPFFSLHYYLQKMFRIKCK